jgi:catechol-2,3-dioxygenase
MADNVKVPEPAHDRGRVAPAKLAHFVLRTPRYTEMIRWYETVLEAKVVAGSDMATFMTYDDEHHRVAFINLPDCKPADPNTAGVDHCAFTYETIEDLFATYERLKGVGIEPYWTINHGPTLSFYYRDPDGNQIELQIDIFESNEKLNEWMRASDFDSNPIGVKFDAQELIARYRAGEPASELLARPVIEQVEVPAQFPG